MGEGKTFSSSGIIKLNAEDYIFMTAAQDSTDNSIGIGNLASNGGGTFMTMTYLGPAS